MANEFVSILDQIEEMLDSENRKTRFKPRTRSLGLRGSNSVIEPPPQTSQQSYTYNNKLIDQTKKYNQKTNNKGDGPAQFESFTLRLPPSSTIQTATYWPTRSYLIVSFKSGHSYDYREVPFKLIKTWMRATSAGSFFYYNIRTAFRYSKI